MTTLYTSNFDSESSGVIATGWVAKTGTWEVGTTLPISGSQSFASTTKISADTAIYTGAGTIADTIFETSQKLAQINQTCAYYMGVRFDSAAANGYLFAFENTGAAGAFQIKFYKKVSGSFTVLNTPTTVLTGASLGDVLHAEIKAIGTSFEVRLWLNNNAKPTSATQSFTDSSITAAGYPALYFGNTSNQSISVDDVIVSDNSSGATATLSGPTSGVNGVASTNFTVTLSASSGTNTTISLADSPTGGTFTPSSLTINAGSTTGTFTYTPATTGNKSISINPNNGYTAAGSPILYTVSAANATSMTLSGATSGSVNTGTTLTVTLNGPAASNTSVTFADSNTGTFSTNPITILAGNTSGTTTFTPTVVGSHTISISSSPVLTSTGTLSYTASAGPVSVATSDSNWFWAPYVWDTVGGNKRAINCGAYTCLSFTGTSVVINIDVSVFVANSVAAGRYPTIRASIDNAPTTVTQLTSSTTGISYSGLVSGTHTVRLWLDGAYVSPSPDDRWVTPINALIISGATIDSGASTVAYVPRSKRMIIFGDSITEGQHSLGSLTQPSGSSGYASWAPAVALAFDAEYGQIGFAAQGYDTTGVGGVPSFWNSGDGTYKYYSSGRSRLSGGLFTPTPDYVIINLGENGQGSTTAGHVQTMITNIRTACGGATSSPKIYVMIPFSQGNLTSISNGFNNYVAAVPTDTNTFLINLGTSWKTGLDVHSGGSATEQAIDNLHPRQTWNAKLSAAIVQKIQSTITGGGGSGTYPTSSQVLTGVSFGPNGNDYTGNVTLPTASQVLNAISFGASGTQYTGNVTLPPASAVVNGTSYGVNGTQYNGNVTIPVVGNVVVGIQYGTSGTQYTGTFTSPATSDVKAGVQYGTSGTQYTGIYSPVDTWDSIIEGNITARQLMKLMGSVLVGKSSGMGTNSPVFRSLDDSKDRITATTDINGNRVSVTTNVS